MGKPSEPQSLASFPLAAFLCEKFPKGDLSEGRLKCKANLMCFSQFVTGEESTPSWRKRRKILDHERGKYRTELSMGISLANRLGQRKEKVMQGRNLLSSGGSGEDLTSPSTHSFNDTMPITLPTEY